MGTEDDRVFGILASAWGAGCTLALLVDPGFARTVNLN
jgi:hypothetical protein